MRYRATIERRREREEFCYMFQKEIKEVSDKAYSTWPVERLACIKFVREVVRKHLDYTNTYDYDIWITVLRTYHSMTQQELVPALVHPKWANW